MSDKNAQEGKELYRWRNIKLGIVVSINQIRFIVSEVVFLGILKQWTFVFLATLFFASLHFLVLYLYAKNIPKTPNQLKYGMVSLFIIMLVGHLGIVGEEQYRFWSSNRCVPGSNCAELVLVILGTISTFAFATTYFFIMVVMIHANHKLYTLVLEEFANGVSTTPAQVSIRVE